MIRTTYRISHLELKSRNRKKIVGFKAYAAKSSLHVRIANRVLANWKPLLRASS